MSTVITRTDNVLATGVEYLPSGQFLLSIPVCSKRELTLRSLYAIARTSVYLSSVVYLSVCNARARCTLLGRFNFRNISTALGTSAIRRHTRKISRRSSQGNPSAGGVKHKRDSQLRFWTYRGLYLGNEFLFVLMATVRSRCGHYIFALWFLLLLLLVLPLFFSRLISAVAISMPAILPHMVWP